MTETTPDRRLHAYRDDLANSALRGRVTAPRYVDGRPAQVTAGLAPVLQEPRPGSPLDTFFHYGEPVCVFAEADGFTWCQSRRDGYVGYVDAAALGHGEPPAPTHYVISLGAYRYAEPDLRAPVIDLLPRHSPVTVVQDGLIWRGTRYVRLAGDAGFIPEACVAEEPPRSPDLTAAAVLYTGAPYLWAGRSFRGIDCSGLVQEAFRDLGVAVPRDTDMQRETIGAPLAIGDLHELRRNDLVYIPGHVMICAGEGHVIHASGGRMEVRQDDLATLLRDWGYGIANLTVRRP